ncbi:PQQ-binding-like beta-propeller repeat protein [Myxococcus stipitatus]|uniref:outer membrane protein assembly factor BamB family protein n=1 Tax=Myxococcus stipitatus TaxID=83455 RepID=UPI002DD41B89|nr:PQQ-binding-like beta-propeller repeat protein [Myxococcus stipitatus]
MLPTLVLTVVAAVGCREPAETAFRYSTDASSRAGLTALPDGVLTGNEAGAVLRVDPTGRVVWRVALGREVATRPAVAADSVIVGTVAGDLARLALSDGTERWRLTGEAPVLTPPVAEEDGTAVYVVAPDGAVRSHAVDTGKVRWRAPAPRADEAHLDTTRGLPAPVLADGLLVVAQGDAGLVALSTADGARAWRQDVPGVLGLVATKDVLFASTRERRVRALRLKDGSPLWEQTPATALTGPPSLALGTLWVGAREDEADVLLGLSPTDGKEVFRVPLPAPLVTGVAEAHGELLVVPTNGRQGRLLVLAPRDVAHAISLRSDTPLRTRPVVLGAQVFVLGMDGRVLSWRLRAPKP